MSDSRYTIAVDFDGVIHRYDTPWIATDVIPDPPVEGAIEWLWKMLEKFDVAIMSTRNSTNEGRNAMRSWLDKHGGPSIEVAFPEHKPPALVYVDDRAWRFEGPGTFPSVDDVHRALPWHKRDDTPIPPDGSIRWWRQANGELLLEVEAPDRGDLAEALSQVIRDQIDPPGEAS